jgi:hypothetical protein
MPLTRKHFLSTAAAGASIAALASGSPADAADASDMRSAIKLHNLKAGEFDAPAMMKTLTQSSNHKQVFQSVSPIVIAPGLASLYLHMQNSMNAYQFSLGLGSLATLGVLIGPSIVFALNDAMWAKYNLGKALGTDLAATNIYYKATTSLDPNAAPDDPNGLYQDWSAQAVLKRGGAFFVCHNATSAIAMMVSGKTGGDPKVTLADFERSLLPGFQMVPAGVAAVQQAQENGWKPFPII